MEALHAEACITSSNASVVVELLCMQLASLCVSISEDGGNRVHRFDAGRALLRSVGDSLMMRVEADDVLTCHSIRVALEGSLVEICGVTQTGLLWVAAQKQPFVALADYSAAMQEQPEPAFSAEGHGPRGYTNGLRD